MTLTIARAVLMPETKDEITIVVDWSPDTGYRVVASRPDSEVKNGVHSYNLKMALKHFSNLLLDHYDGKDF